MKRLVCAALMRYLMSTFFGLVLTTSAVTGSQAQAVRHKPVCSHREGIFCTSRVVVDGAGTPVQARPHRNAATLNAGTPYGPAQFLGGYNLTGLAQGLPIVAIVDAYDDPYIVEELSAYNSFYGLSQLATCVGSISTSSVPCFQKINQQGVVGNYPGPPPLENSWLLEIALDVEIVHAVCQNCSVALVEANTAAIDDLGVAENTAVSLGATAVSNSWGGQEQTTHSHWWTGNTPNKVAAQLSKLDKAYFAHQGVAIVFASGDQGYQDPGFVLYPASSSYVTAAGGTTLILNSDNSYNSETAWSGAGSGCSIAEPKPAWQTDTGCSNRTVADVSADADPNTGAAVYSVGYTGTGTWFQVGGTSLATPIVASVYALSGYILPANWESSIPYARTGSLHDVMSGSNSANGCSSSYLCNADPGYDGPTGLGTPNGVGAF